MGIEIDNKLRTRAISADGAWSGAIYLPGLACPKHMLNCLRIVVDFLLL